MNKEALTTVEMVALYLGQPWKYNRLREPCAWGYEIIDGSGRGLYFRVDGQKFRISGNFPSGRYYSEYGDYKSIGVSMSRPAKDIAADITRRLLPKYQEAYDKALQAKQERQQQEAHLDLLAQTVQRVSGGRVYQHGRGARNIQFEEGTAELWHGGDFSMSLNHLTIEQVIQVIAALRQ